MNGGGNMTMSINTHNSSSTAQSKDVAGKFSAVQLKSKTGSGAASSAMNHLTAQTINNDQQQSDQQRSLQNLEDRIGPAFKVELSGKAMMLQSDTKILAQANQTPQGVPSLTTSEKTDIAR